ncbi:MAG TPA: DUF362 domain-containing protein, partial [Pyrinomonadaceae bacterium]|nr:DUF362 domain-containing protein [Pyrinomonadaceae bacterium]
ENLVYDAVREVLRDSGLDSKNFGTSLWNPLGDLVSEGGTVLIKPNWVHHYHLYDYDPYCMITHPSVLRPLVDYAFKAVGPAGHIWMMDAPYYGADFSKLSSLCGLEAFESVLRARGVPLTIGDLRSFVLKVDRGVVVERIQRHTWSSEGVIFNLGSDGEVTQLGHKLRNVRRITTSFHRNENVKPGHLYRIARRALEADLVISVPKLKTHRKAGVSLNIKNMMGIVTDKNYIPHYRSGSPSEGGDEYPDTKSVKKYVRRLVVRAARAGLNGLGETGERIGHAFMRVFLALRQNQVEKKVGHKMDPVDLFYYSVQGNDYRMGDWWGNDTCWRGALDVNKILLYGTPDGHLSDSPARRYLGLIDGIIGGDESGPLAPHVRHEGVLIAGFDPLSVDQVATQIMGFDPRLVRDQRRASELIRYPLANNDLPIRVISNWPEWRDCIRPESALGFRPHYAWKEYFERALSQS